MIKLTLLTIWVLLVFVLAVGILSYLAFKIYESFDRKPIKAVVPPVPYLAIEAMEAIVQNKNSPAENLDRVANSLIAHHKIPAKIEGKTGKEGKRYIDMIFTLASHKHVNESLVQSLYDGLIKANPEYRNEFERARSR